VGIREYINSVSRTDAEFEALNNGRHEREGQIVPSSYLQAQFVVGIQIRKNESKKTERGKRNFGLTPILDHIRLVPVM